MPFTISNQVDAFSSVIILSATLALPFYLVVISNKPTHGLIRLAHRNSDVFMPYIEKINVDYIPTKIASI